MKKPQLLNEVIFIHETALTSSGQIVILQATAKSAYYMIVLITRQHCHPVETNSA